jgi:large subunit ribosomal protein L18
MKGSTDAKILGRLRRKRRVRRKVAGTASRPRLTVFRSAKHIYAQVIDDVSGRTLAAASSVDKEFARDAELAKRDASRAVGELLAKRCLANQVETVVFDRNGYPYQSLRVRSLAEAAREAGLKF